MRCAQYERWFLHGRDALMIVVKSLHETAAHSADRETATIVAKSVLTWHRHVGLPAHHSVREARWRD